MCIPDDGQMMSLEEVDNMRPNCGKHGNKGELRGRGPRQPDFQPQAAIDAGVWSKRGIASILVPSSARPSASAVGEDAPAKLGIKTSTHHSAQGPG